jgi:hypothetical protein
VADAVLLRVERPYASEDEYIAQEGWTIDDKSIVLVGQEELPKDTVVRFEVVLADGSKPIRAEGKVSRLIAATSGKPGGLKVRFRRFDAATKKFIERAVAERKAARRSRKPPASELPPLVLEPEAAAPASMPAPDAESEPDAAPEIVAGGDAVEAAMSPPPVKRGRAQRAGPKVVSAPPNRDELLQRLRDRLAKIRKAEPAGENAG